MGTALRRVRRGTDRILHNLGVAARHLEGTLRGNKLRAYWYTSVVNFGDLITPLLLRHYGFTPIHASIEDAKVFSTGSVLQIVPQDYSGHILGSGLINEMHHPLTNAKIWAVRGKLTRDAIGAPKGTVLGDPGLLSSELLPRRMKRGYVLGFVPHYAEMDDPRLAMIINRYKDDILFIDVKRDPLAVLEEIDSCEAILSSSLHGIVAADSLGIPSAWMFLTDAVRGGGYKFRDYFSVFGEEALPVPLGGDETLSELLKHTKPHSNGIEAIKNELDNTFRSFRACLTSA